MKSTLFALTLLCSAAASAQVVVGDEVVSDPLKMHATGLSLAAPAVSLAKDKSGVAIAWSMANADFLERVYVGRLDATGNVTGAVRVIPLTTAAPSHAVYPSLAPAPGGSGFVLAWLELDPMMQTIARAAFCRLNAELTPSSPVSLEPMVFPAAPPLVQTKGGTAWISAGGYLWSLTEDGTLSGPLAGLMASDMTIATNVPQLIGGHSAQGTNFSCKPDLGCRASGGPFNGFCYEFCRIYPTTFSLDFTALLTTSQSRTFNYASDAQPAIDSNGSEVLMVWFRGAQASGGDVVASRLSLADLLHFSDTIDHPQSLAQFGPDAGRTRPDIATDGHRYVIVWRTPTRPGNHDIVGMILEEDGKLTPLSIATSSADERDPAILYLGGGTFLVGYEKMSGSERRIAGRFLTFGRRRAAR